MLKSLATKSSLAAGIAMIGALVVAPQQASAGFHFGGFHGGGAPRITFNRPAFHPVFRPAFHPVFRPAFRPVVHFASRHPVIGGYRPGRVSGLGRHERGEHERLGRERGHERTRLGRLEHERGRHGHGRGYAPAFYRPDYAEPDNAGPTDVTQPTVERPFEGPVSGAVAASGAPIADKTAGPAAPTTCQPGTGTGSAVEVTFAQKATTADVSNFLKAYNVTIVDGPIKDNRYRIRLSDRTLPPNEVMQAVHSMQSQTAIVTTVSVF